MARKKFDTSKITEAFAKRVLTVVDAGLVSGLGLPTPGQMCVEAAVAYAAGEDHHDHPECVDGFIANLKIDLNDANGWQSNHDRAEGLRRVAIAQLGSVTSGFSYQKLKLFMKEKMVTGYQPFGLAKSQMALSTIVQAIKDAESKSNLLYTLERMKEYVPKDEYVLKLKTKDVNIYVPSMFKYVKAARPEMTDQDALKEIAEIIVQGLIAQNVPGTKFLYLTEKPARAARKPVKKPAKKVVRRKAKPTRRKK